MLPAVWILAACALALWSLAAWGLHALLRAGPAWLDDPARLVGLVPFGDWIDRWLPGWQALLTATLELGRDLLGAIGDSALLVSLLAWAAGALCIVGGAALLSLSIVLLRRQNHDLSTSTPSR